MTALREALEHTALGWIKPELDETLRLAKAELEDYVEDPADVGRMRLCAGYLHQVQGTLRMVELYAPAMVAEEMEQVALGLHGGTVADRDGACAALLRGKAKDEGLWLPHMPAEWGGMGLGHVALAMVQAEAAKTRVGPWVLNCQAPDEGNMHTLLHWATPEQAEKYLRPLCDGVTSSCFAMTEPEVAGSDPTLIRTHAVKDGDEWVINGHKWFISGAKRA